MKIDVDYNMVHALKDLLRVCKDGVELNGAQVNIVSKFLEATEGDLYPSREEIEAHAANCRLMDKTDPQKDPERWKWVSEEVTDFENKYL